MPNLNEEVRIRTTVDNTQADKGLADLPIKVRKAGQATEREFSNMGRKAGDAFGRELDSRMNKSMRLVGQTFSRYFGEWGRMFGEIFQVGKDVSEILPRRRGGSGGHGGSSAGIIAADVGSDVAQMSQTAAGNRKIVNELSGNGNGKRIQGGWDASGKSLKPLSNTTGLSQTVSNGAVSGAAAGGVLGALPGLLAGLGIGALVTVLGYYLIKTQEAKKETLEFAKALGLSFKTAKEFLSIGKQVNQLDAFTDSLTNIVDLLDKAQKGSKSASKTLSEFGINQVYTSKESAQKAMLGNIMKISDSDQRDIASLRAGVPIEVIDEMIRKESLAKQPSTMLEKLFGAKPSTPVDNLLPSDTRTLIARESITQQDLLTNVDPEKTKEAEAVTKAIQQQVEAAKELAEVGKSEDIQTQNKIRDLERSISLAEIELGHADSIVEAEAKKAEIAKLNLSLAEQKEKSEKQQFDISKKRIELENSIIDNRMKLAKDGKLSMSDLSKTNSPAGREAKAIDKLEENYTNAIANGNKSAAEQIKKRIDDRKLKLVQSGILSPDELQYQETDSNGFISQFGFNKADVLAGIANNGKKMTAAELLKSQQDRGGQLARGNVAGVANQAEFIRGVRTTAYKDEIANSASMLEIINRNGGALPVRALIQ